MRVPFVFIDHEQNKELALYFEDDKIALNTVDDNPKRTTYHEIMLNRQAVQLLIEALQEMQADIRKRYPLMLESPRRTP